MKKVSLAVLLSLSAVASAAYAQSDQGVTMSTDPAKIADVESRAQALQSRQESQKMTEQTPSSHKSMHHKKSHSKPAAPSQ
ncbi:MULTISPECIES: hypothetical protein [Caballeronia]|jgi:hypothetical protein|uniref:Signal peptide protein n=1 Tax=Caballeronia zhejiangensis TaxID=871203 RepID=A0A656QDF3_9BURK|nr:MULTISPECIES: hypothetical protein [Caballeronia]EKS67532.1 putative signal peptide protein [Burkholderia sp. SJ98]KDR27459.1 signal peptide protein [Caballeronia zhejiangensis]MCG7403612.1 hypothetical protein [Caballeronia zhejiangensis]MCI1045522.1 hypothetical protein [Caballeronia zhejiangensis]MDR5765436.1 hypothetical protein [Caballeronia sp. LZ028]